jgi:tRNA(Ile2) C34 agmatinyltransferase TiaS
MSNCHFSLKMMEKLTFYDELLEKLEDFRIEKPLSTRETRKCPICGVPINYRGEQFNKCESCTCMDMYQRHLSKKRVKKDVETR